MSSLKLQTKHQKRNSRLRERVCVTVAEWCESTGTSKPSAYRAMAGGRLHYVQMSKRVRRIPTTEYERLGLVAPEADKPVQ